MTRDVSSAARLVLVGVGGYGRVHAERIARLADRGLVELVAAVDPAVVLDPPVVYGVGLYADLAEAFAAAGPVDVVSIAAPIGVHFQLARTALTSGADVFLEKPPVTSLEEFSQLLDLEQETGRVVQVGFQSLGSDAVELLRTDAFGIGPMVSLAAEGAWLRTVGYWTRSPWSGRRSLRGRAVLDGVVPNQLAHAVATALAIAGCRRLEDVDSVETDLYRANEIDCDDTSVVRIRTTQGLVVTCALSLCAPVEREPKVHVDGANGRASFAYKSDRIDVESNGRASTRVTPRTDLLDNLLAHRRDGSPLLVPLASTGAFMRVLAAVPDADEPVRIDPRAISWGGEGPDRHAVVADIENWLAKAVATGRTFTELGVPWAHRERDTVLVHAQVGEVEVARYLDGRGTIPTSTPRPFLHPVRTLSGVVLTARHPADHDWHNGVGMAIPDVNGSSFWGGGTYVHGTGYVLLDNHGEVVGEPPEVRDNGFRQRLRWIARDGSTALSEHRTVGWTALEERTWKLTFESSLTADAGATIDSPGSKGRLDAGYGGFFWRFCECANVDVFTADARGEDDVLGSVAPWVAWSADFAAGPGVSGPATIVIAGTQAAAAGEPWFVRARDYPGLGSALAWDRPVVLAPGEQITRRFDIAIADGRLTEAEASQLAGELAEAQTAQLAGELTESVRPAAS